MKLILSVLSSVFLVANAEARETLTYDCRGDVDQVIQITGDRLTVSSTDTLNGMNFVAAIDDTYRPQKPNKVRFIGAEKGNRRAIILFSGMLNGARSGFVTISGSEDGYWSDSFRCVLTKK